MANFQLIQTEIVSSTALSLLSILARVTDNPLG
jgi:hypothetical protein